MAEEWLALLRNVRTTRRKLAEGETLFRAGDAATALFHVEQGRIRLVRQGLGGRRVILHRAGPGEPFAETALFSDLYDGDAVAEEATELRVYPKTAILLLLRAHPDLNLAFSAYLARQLQRLRGRFEAVRIKSARERVLAFLTQAGAMEGAVTLDRPLTQVAAEIGLTREALYRTLTKLEKDGTLTREGVRVFRLHATRLPVLPVSR